PAWLRSRTMESIALRRLVFTPVISLAFSESRVAFVNAMKVAPMIKLTTVTATSVSTRVKPAVACVRPTCGLFISSLHVLREGLQENDEIRLFNEKVYVRLLTVY